MNTKLMAFALLLGSITLFGACKKKSSEGPSGPSAGNITPGQCTISFNTDKDFNGTTSINLEPGATTFAVRTPNGTIDQLTLTATKTDVATMKTATVQFVIMVPTGATTSGGNLTVPFDGGSDNFAVITVSNLSVGNATPAYASESGAVTITKLTETELEGTFTAHAINEDEGTSINLKDGKFAARFQ